MTPNSLSQRPLVHRALGVGVILCAVFSIQAVSSAYKRDFAGHSDEPAHFVTGVMVHDYLTTAAGSSPMRFAEEYYVRYPKVAIGHWPPAFYTVQGIWYLLLGDSKISVTLLIGLISAATACCLYFRLLNQHQPPIALLTIAVFLGQPLVRNHAILIMPDMMTCFGTLLAVFAFSDYLGSPTKRHAISFVVWSSFAILTRPSALALAIFVPICVLATRQFPVLKNWKLWAAGAAVGVLTAPFYLWTWVHGLGLHGHGSVSEMAASSVRASVTYNKGDACLSVASGCLALVSVLGFLSVVIPSWHEKAEHDVGRFDAGAAIALCCATMIFLFAAPVFLETRYFLPLLAGMMFLYARGLELLWQRLPGPKPLVGIILLFIAVLAVATAPGNQRAPVYGYAVAAESFGASQPGRVTLISSDSIGDGAFIAERLLRDRDRSEFVLRASKVLERSGWSGGHYSVRFSTLDQLRGFLDSVPVHFVVINDFAYRNDTGPPSHKLLKELLAESAEQFPMVEAFTVDARGRRFVDAIRIYENRSARNRQMVGIELDMKTSLGRTLRLGSGDQNSGE